MQACAWHVVHSIPVLFSAPAAQLVSSWLCAWVAAPAEAQLPAGPGAPPMRALDAAGPRSPDAARHQLRLGQSRSSPAPQSVNDAGSRAANKVGEGWGRVSEFGSLGHCTMYKVITCEFLLQEGR